MYENFNQLVKIDIFFKNYDNLCTNISWAKLLIHIFKGTFFLMFTEK